MTKKVLVTGAAGFIGFHLLKQLSELGISAIGFDNFNDYYDVELKRAREKQLSKREIAIVEGDICNKTALCTLVESKEITHIVNLAAQAGVRYSLENPMAYIHSNIEGFTQVLETCKEYPHLHLTYASSSSVYGRNTKVPFSVDDRVDQQASLYGATKKSNELLANVYNHLYNIPSVGLRFFTVYGPWGRPDMAYFSFTKAILEERPIKVFNHGKMERDFTYIDDIVDGVIASMNISEGCHVYNLGNNTPVSLMHFIEVIEDALGKKAIKEFMPMEPGDVKNTYADITLSEQDLCFSPQTPLEKGIPQFINWYRSYYTEAPCTTG